jgi:hypothetical protein
MLPVQQEGLLKFWVLEYTRIPNRLDEHKICVPVSWLPPRQRSLIALQCPSSVGIRPVIKLIERIISRSLLVYQSINLSKIVFTRQSVASEAEAQHSRAEPELRRDCTCGSKEVFFRLRYTPIDKSAQKSAHRSIGCRAARGAL